MARLNHFYDASKALWILWITIIVSAGTVFGNAHDFCGGLIPQSTVGIQQLLGMWYGIEVIDHVKTDHTLPMKKIIDYSCPVLQFFEEETPSTESPLHLNYNYDTHYGSGYGTAGSRDYPRNNPYEKSNEDISSLFDRVRHGNASKEDLRRYHRDIKRLKVLWDENGVLTAYTIRYNVSVPGFWITSGPQNGNIHVLKAVGNHMVLTFCQRMPDEQLITILLSRSISLSQHEISGVHDLLDRRNLELVTIRKVCVNSGASGFAVLDTLLMMVLTFLVTV